MSAVLEAESTLTDRYQTTVPEPVRRALALSKRDKIRYSIRANGEVVLSRSAPEEAADPALLPFLRLIERDIRRHPKRLRAIDGGLAERIQALVAGVEVDLEAPLAAEEA
ncbi:MAG: hypothetical protein KatS3mg125_1082 [Lysobacterales bacterium]|jgi:antitoxin PrlF|nr:MAG: hypothetical protein KatS3mg125_1082 [Xanthomonadales bacterium]